MGHEIHRWRAFTKEGKGGNPAGVVDFADELSKEQMQQIAADLVYPETAFVLKAEPGEGTCKLSFYTPTQEIALCGHATIAALHCLFGKRITRQRRRVKERKLQLASGESLSYVCGSDTVFYQQPLPILDERSIPNAALADVLGLKEISEGLSSAYQTSPGIVDVLIEVEKEEKLQHLNPNMEDLKILTEQNDIAGVHLYYVDTDAHSEWTAHSRNLAPAVGIPEEAATGSTTGVLAYHLAMQNRVPKDGTDLHFQQGRYMESGEESEIFVRVEQDSVGEIRKLMVGGRGSAIL